MHKHEEVLLATCLTLHLPNPSLNRHQKSGKDLAEWLPELNQCWFVKQVVAVKRKYNLSMDTREAETARRVWEIVRPLRCLSMQEQNQPRPTTYINARSCCSSRTTRLVSQVRLKRNGRITCKEAGACGLSRPVPSSHPAYQYMTDRDGDGQVCE